MGDIEAPTPVGVESTLEYHPSDSGALTAALKQVVRQYQVGSLTGAVASICGAPWRQRQVTKSSCMLGRPFSNAADSSLFRVKGCENPAVVAASGRD